MAFAQLTYRQSLRDIEFSLRVHSSKLYHIGILSGVSRNTLANTNQVRDRRIYADFAQQLIHIARPFFRAETYGLGFDNTVYALGSSTIDLCLSLIPWAGFRKTKAAVKLHTLLDLQENIPTFTHISDGKLHDVNVSYILLPERGTSYVMDRAYLDFTRLAVCSCFDPNPIPPCEDFTPILLTVAPVCGVQSNRAAHWCENCAPLSWKTEAHQVS